MNSAPSSRNNSMKTLLRSQIEADLARLDQRVQAFTRQLADFVQITILDQQGQFTFLRRLLNYDAWRIAGMPQSTQFLDYQVVNSNIEAERDHLRVGDHFVRVLTMKEAITRNAAACARFALEDSSELHGLHRMDAASRGQGPQGSEQASPAFQYVEDGIRLAARQRCDEDKPARCPGR